MNAPEIKFTIANREYSLPNRWELLTPKLYLHLCGLLHRFSTGELSMNEVRIHYTCAALGLKPGKIKTPEACQNLYLLASTVDFIFNITYPAGSIDGLPADIKKLLRKTPPENIPEPAISRYLKKQKYQYQVDASFAAQLLPELRIKRKRFPGYTLSTTFDVLTCSLTALQFIEAYELLGSLDKLPLLAAILYFPDKKYSSEQAHHLAGKFKHLDMITLQAVALNFQAFVNYLFSSTQFSLLRGKKGEQTSSITTGMAETLYNLSADGMGDVEVVEQMPVIKYFSILRKKLIESIKAMADSKIDLLEIANKTGLSINTIKKIV